MFLLYDRSYIATSRPTSAQFGITLQVMRDIPATLFAAASSPFTYATVKQSYSPYGYNRSVCRATKYVFYFRVEFWRVCPPRRNVPPNLWNAADVTAFSEAPSK